MNRLLTISPDPIDEAALVAARVLSHGMGAAVYFSGVVRGSEDGASIQALEYETFQRMAGHQFGLLFDEMEKRWPVESVRLVHRIGLVKVNEGDVFTWATITLASRLP